MPPPDPTPLPPPTDGPDPGDDDLVAYLDGELAADDARTVESKLALDPAERAKAEVLKKTYDLLDHLPKPEPSPTFASRTLTQMNRASGGSVPALPFVRRSRWKVAAWAAAALFAVGGGYAARALIPVPVAAADLAFSDVRVVEHLPLYLGADDLDYVKRLDDAELFGGDADARPPAIEEPVGPAQRESLTTTFNAYPPARRQQLRALDQQLHALDGPTRDRLFGVLEKYAVWLDRLADADRKEVLAAPAPAERLDAVRLVKNRAWRASLPEAHRKKLDAVAAADERAKLVADYKKQEADQRADWDLARRQWDAVQAQRKPWPFADEVLAKEVDEYVRTVLKPRLRGAEADALGKLADDARAADARPFSLLAYGATVWHLSETHPMLPPYGNGTKPPTRLADVNLTHPEFIKRLNRESKGPENFARRFRDAPQYWPEFCEALAAEAKAAKVSVPFPLGPAKPGEFAPAVDAFLASPFAGKATPGEKAELAGLLGQWPAYPKKLMEVARKHDLPVPGVTPPGPPSRWEKYYRPVRGGRRP